MRCQFCNRRASYEAFIPNSKGQWAPVCKSHFMIKGCSFKEGMAEAIICNPPSFNLDCDDILEGMAAFNQEVQLNG